MYAEIFQTFADPLSFRILPSHTEFFKEKREFYFHFEESRGFCVNSVKIFPTYLKPQEVLYETYKIYQAVQLNFPFMKPKHVSYSKVKPFRFDDTPLSNSLGLDRSIKLKLITNGSNIASTEKARSL
jgi:hypothetical protein